MKRWPMYTELQSLKNLGFSKRQVANRLQVDFRTVSKYWDMDPDTFESTLRTANGDGTWPFTRVSSWIGFAKTPA